MSKCMSLFFLNDPFLSIKKKNDSTLDLPLAARLAGKRPSTDIKMVLKKIFF